MFEPLACFTTPICCVCKYYLTLGLGLKEKKKKYTSSHHQQHPTATPLGIYSVDSTQIFGLKYENLPPVHSEDKSPSAASKGIASEMMNGHVCLSRWTGGATARMGVWRSEYSLIPKVWIETDSSNSGNTANEWPWEALVHSCTDTHKIFSRSKKHNTSLYVRCQCCNLLQPMQYAEIVLPLAYLHCTHL